MRIEDVKDAVEQFKITDATSEDEKQTIALFWIVRQLETIKDELYDVATALRVSQGQPGRPKSEE